MDAQNGRQQPGLWRSGTRVETQAGNATGDAIATGPRVLETTGPPSDVAEQSADIAGGGTLARLKRRKHTHTHTHRRCKVISAWRKKHLLPLSPTTKICHCPLFRSVCVSGMRAVKQTSDRLTVIAKRHVAIILLTVGLLSGGR